MGSRYSHLDRFAKRSERRQTLIEMSKIPTYFGAPRDRRQGRAKISVLPNELVLSIRDTITFASGKTELSPTGLRVNDCPRLLNMADPSVLPTSLLREPQT
jgi:hypothetical protein